MSRCFPYPPPGFSVASRDDALIESIKLQKEREKANAEKKKEKKREMKEKRREEKHRRKENKGKANLNSSPNEQAPNSAPIEQAPKVEKNCAFLEGAHGNKRRRDDAEQLEWSGITEEHGEPSQNPCYSSDSTQNSNKRKKLSSPSNGIRTQGNVLRIRLPLQKHKEPEASKEQKREEPEAIKEWPCSTSVRTDLPARTSIQAKNDKELVCSTSGRTEILAQDKTQNAAIRTSIQRGGKQRVHSPYTSLFENWVPMGLNSEPDFDDQEWLFGTRTTHQEKHVEKVFKGCSDTPSCGSSVLWPRAQYLPEADIYALPFTVPF